MSSPTPTAALQEVTRLNKEGVRCLANHDSEMAYHFFRATLAFIHQHLIAPEDTAIVAAEAEDLPDMIAVPVPGLDDDLFYIHGQALFVDFTSCSTDAASSVQLASSILLFNMALSCHQHGIQTQSESMLQTACQLYQHCSALQGYDNPLAHCIEFASLNNQAQIQNQYLDNPHQAVVLLHRLNAAAIVLSLNPFLETTHFDEMILNRITLSGGARPAAPAA